jgi:aryl-alcohol dehydrogenase-like predicted oxidoreductase
MYGPPPDPDAARASVRRAVDAGVQLIDTADCYGPEVVEELIADALAPYAEDLVISTKGGRIALGGNRWRADGRPEHLREACDGSLRRLRLDHIDLYQLNAVDPAVPIADSVGALVELRDAGKIRHLGLCNVDVSQLREALRLTPIVSVQDRYDLTTRAAQPVLSECERRGIAFLPWFPPDNGRTAAPGSVLERIGTRHAASPAQIALAWLVRSSPVTVPLPGSTRPGWVDEDLAGLSVVLDDDEVLALGGPADG